MVNTRQGPRPVSKVFKNGEKEVVTTKLLNGKSLTLTDTHNIITKTGDVMFKDLTSSDIVYYEDEKCGFIETENINTEWNYNILSPQRDKDNAKNAAFTACALTSFQDSYLDYAFRYRGTGDNNRLVKFIGFDLSLFSYDGLYKTPTLIYKIFHIMSKETPYRIKTSLMDSKQGITYIAGVSGDLSNISILISNFETEAQDYLIDIENIGFDSNYTVFHYLIDDTNDFKIIHEKDYDNKTFAYEEIIEKSTVHYIRISNSSIIPKEGPIVFEIPFLQKLKFLDPIRQLLGFFLMVLIFG